MNKVVTILGRLIDGLGNFCTVLMILMVANVFYDVVMRYFFNDVSIAMQELEWHLFAAMFMFGIAYTLKEDAHVRVDIVYDKLSARKKAWVNIFGSLVFALPITLIILYFSIDYTFDAFEMGEGSPDPGGLPHRWIVRAIIPTSSVFLLLAIVYVILSNLQILSAPQPQEESEELR